tara:strand:+ start:681 stop:1082 length:402 start_codon:yes stop_codon:yes gene_type:complete
MEKSYLAKIIAKDLKGLQIISACCSEAKVKVEDMKFLKKNKIFLISLQRLNKENYNDKEKINSICKFDFIDKVKSKHIDQNNNNLVLELLTINILKKEQSFEIILLFKNNAFITLSAEIIEVTLEDQNRVKND